MATQTQINSLSKKLKEYKKRFIKHKDLDEASTRIMINYFLTDILGYVEFEDIKTEYRIAGEYADYVIQIGRKKHFVIETKSIQIDLDEKHLRQALNYAANEGIDWILLTNGETFILYKVLFNKPISSKKIFEYNLSKITNFDNASAKISLLLKKSVVQKQLDKHWERFKISEPKSLSGLLYHKNVVSGIRKTMKQKSGLNFSEEEILDGLYQVITQPLESARVKKPIEFRSQKKKITDEPKTV